MNWNELAEAIARMKPEQRTKPALVYNFNPVLGDENRFELLAEDKENGIHGLSHEDNPALLLGDELE